LGRLAVLYSAGTLLDELPELALKVTSADVATVPQFKAAHLSRSLDQRIG
jgi:hypothetical protein